MSARRTTSHVPLTVLLGLVAGCTTSVSSISPTSVAAGGPAFNMTVLGKGFSQGATVQWNGSSRSTTFVSATELVAQINAADIASAGSASITVTSPLAADTTSSSGSGTSNGASNAETIDIVTPSTDATAYQIDPAHDGAMTFSSVSFPSAATWSVSLGAGTPSNVVIADNLVFLTVGSSNGSTLLALNQSTGATAWGPTSIPGAADGSAGVAYDNGEVFVTDNESSSSSLYAYNAGTGALEWSTAFDAGSAGAPTAADGFVYVIVSGSATLYALDESTGSIAWQQSLSAASGTSAVTADGVYVAATTSGCYTIDFRPPTGETIWSNSDGAVYCVQTTGESPAVSNQLVYSPSASGTSIFAAETGTSTGIGTLADSLPAAFTSDTAYFLEGSNLDAVTLSDGTVAWSFNGNGSALTALPIVVNQYVITGSTDGTVYAVDGSSGSQSWSQRLSGQVAQLSAGDGLLLVDTEAANDSSGTLTAYTLSTDP